MANIYDVAKLAEVSISTVSNYLNNKYIGPEKRKAIQQAIEELHYVPSQSAKSLKTKKSNQVAVIIPNVDEYIYSEILMGINMHLSANGYRLVLYITDDICSKEESYLRECLTSEYAGVLLCTCNPDSTPLFIKLMKRCPVVFILRKPSKISSYNYVGFNDYETIYNITIYFLSRGHEDICMITGPVEYTNEQSCRSAYVDAYSKYNLVPNPDNIISLPLSKESIFKYIIKKFQSGYRSKLILTSSVQIANATIEASLLQNIKLDEDINILSLGEDNWYKFESINHSITTNRPAKKLGMFASETLANNINNPKSFEYINKSLKDDFLYNKLKSIDNNLKRFTSISAKPIYSKKIKLLLTKDDNISDTIKACLPEFTAINHINVEVDTLSQAGIYDRLIEVKDTNDSEYDVFAIDVPWLSYFSQNHCLYNLNTSFDRGYLNRLFSQDTLAKFGQYKGDIFGIPYLNATQFLYYRQDIFDNETYKKEFKDKYGRDLMPPSSWHEYNLIAEFFTKEYNPSSPFDYGTCITQRFSQALAGELYPRIWAYGGSVFDRQDNICVYSDENIKAFTNMAQSLKYTDPELWNLSAYEKTIKFASGDLPMIIAYHHHASVVSDRSISKVIGKVGFDTIPGNTPILAGWSMAINNNSINKDDAITFLDWLLTAQSSMFYTILGGNSPIERIYENPDLTKLYPWFKLVPDSLQSSNPRNTPLINGENKVPEVQIEDILANVIYANLSTGNSIDTLLMEAHESIIQLFEENGYIPPPLV